MTYLSFLSSRRSVSNNCDRNKINNVRSSSVLEFRPCLHDMLLSLFFLLLGALILPMVASAQTGYTGIFGGGPIYKNPTTTISELKNSGFTEVIVWSVEVSSAGDLNLNGEFPLTSNGSYVGNQTYPNFPSTLATLKQGTVKRITFSVGSSNVGDWQHIESLVNSQGTGSSSILYKDFQALKTAIPSLDAIDFDDENNFDSASTIAFGVMLGKLGYHVIPDVFNNSSYWTSVVSQINSQEPGTVDAVHLQTYSGGAGNNPCSGWNFGSVPVFPGIWDSNDTAAQAQSAMKSWYSQCQISGGFLWLYDDIAGKSEASSYAAAINGGLSKSSGNGAYNINGIYSDGTSFSSGGLDGNGYAYSSNLLGSTVTWNGDTFTLGSPNSADVWSNTTIPITPGSGQYSSLDLLASGVGGSQTSQVFTVNYTDGTKTTITQNMSDWYSPQNYSGESKAVTMSYRDTSSGSTDNRTFYLYGYSFPIDSSKTVASLTLPQNRNVVVLAYKLNQSNTTTAPVDLSSYFNRTGMYKDGTTFSSSGGLDDLGDAYSATLLGTTLGWNGATFNFGTANLPNAVSASGQIISLPSGQYSSLKILGTAVNGNQASQTFVVKYSDGTTSTFTQGLSDWYTPQSYSGEATASTMSYRDTSSGSTDNRTFYLYGYSFALNSSKTVSSIQLPNNSNVEILAMTLTP